MHFDSLTLMLPGAFVLAFAGLLLFGAYFHLDRESVLKWWSMACLVNGAGVTLLIAGAASDQIAFSAAGSLVSTVAPPLYWAGIRRWNNRRAPLAVLAVGPAAWLAAAALGPFTGHGSGMWAMMASLAVWPVFGFAAVWELWTTRAERLAYRWPLAGFCALHAVTYIGGIHDTFDGMISPGGVPALFSWFGVIHFETIVFAMGASVILLLLVRERIESRNIEAANTDPLTGMANRRVLVDNAERLLQRCQETGAPLSVVMFDLDHFKRVNDTYGHAAGDRVLTGFADTMRAFLRPNDLLGRYGGEEFVLVLPNVSPEAACAIANRARKSFASKQIEFNGNGLSATVSAGVAPAVPGEPFETAVHAADTALYAAKQAGRNRVMRAGGDAPMPPDNIVRVA